MIRKAFRTMLTLGPFLISVFCACWMVDRREIEVRPRPVSTEMITDVEIESTPVTKDDGWKILIPAARRKIIEPSEGDFKISGEVVPATYTRYAPTEPAFFIIDSPVANEWSKTFNGKYRINAYTEIRANNRVLGYYLLCARIKEQDKSTVFDGVNIEFLVIDSDEDGRFESMLTARP